MAGTREMMERLEQVNRRLGEIQDELMTLADNDFAGKNQLHIERDRLRDEAASYKQDHDKDRPSSDLIDELKQRYSQLESIGKQYVNPAKQTDGGFGGTGAYTRSADAERINQNIDEATGRAHVEQRIHRLEAILKDRGHL